VKDKDLHTYGFLGYPCLQTADIVLYSAGAAALVVPVGEDQVSHVELSREIVRRFNFLNGLSVDERLRERAPFERYLVGAIATVLRDPMLNLQRDAFPLTDDSWRTFVSRFKFRVSEIGYENAIHLLQAAHFPDNTFTILNILSEPGVMLTKTPRIPGLDGRKMSKSYGNAITLSESDDDIRKKTKVMVTDPARKRRTDPGNPDVCPVYDWHKLFSPRNSSGEYSAEGKATLEWAANGCRTAGIGCIECKAKMADHLIEWIAPVRERRLEYEKHPKRVIEVIDEGSKRARVEAQKTISRVREAVFGWEKKRNEIGQL